MAAENRGADNHPTLKSQKSIYSSFVRFLNTTPNCIDVIWLNYEGRRVKYKSIDPGEFIDVNTFVGHPWIFCDSETGERMVAQLRDVFQPIAWDTDSRKWPPKRKIINITIPVYRLQDCCLRAIRKYVPFDKIDKLDVTDVLKDEIYKIFRMNRPVKVARKREITTSENSNQGSCK